MRRLLITGGSSEIGKAITNLARQRDIEVFDPSHEEMDVRFSSLVSTFMELNSPIDYLVNAASMSTRTSFATQPFEAIFNVVALGTFRCIRAFSMFNKTGSIVNISSEAARTGGRSLSAYAAAKAAVNLITITSARELYPIRVNAVAPGVIDTEANKAKDAAALPFGRKGTAEEVAKVVLWLLSDEASYISGAIVPVSGAM